MSAENLALNRKGTKVLIKGKPKVYNLLGTLIQWSPTFAYVAAKYDLFTFKNQGYAITGWGFVILAVAFLMFRSKIRDKFKEYEETFGSLWTRAKSGNIALGIAFVLLIVSLLSTSLFYVFFIFSGSTYASLFLYKPYDDLVAKKKVMQKMLDEKNQTADFAKLTSDYEKLTAGK